MFGDTDSLFSEGYWTLANGICKRVSWKTIYTDFIINLNNYAMSTK